MVVKSVFSTFTSTGGGGGGGGSFNNGGINSGNSGGSGGGGSTNCLSNPGSGKWTTCGSTSRK